MAGWILYPDTLDFISEAEYSGLLSQCSTHLRVSSVERAVLYLEYPLLFLVWCVVAKCCCVRETHSSCYKVEGSQEPSCRQEDRLRALRTPSGTGSARQARPEHLTSRKAGGHQDGEEDTEETWGASGHHGDTDGHGYSTEARLQGGHDPVRLLSGFH